MGPSKLEAPGSIGTCTGVDGGGSGGMQVGAVTAKISSSSLRSPSESKRVGESARADVEDVQGAKVAVVVAVDDPGLSLVSFSGGGGARSAAAAAAVAAAGPPSPLRGDMPVTDLSCSLCLMK